jgi:hypothetical protein
MIAYFVGDVMELISADHDCIFIHIPIERISRVYIGLHGFTWVYTDLHGLHGFKWVYTGLNGFTWTNTGLHGFT